MRNRTYGGVRGRKTKVGEKLLRFPPTRFAVLTTADFYSHNSQFHFLSHNPNDMKQWHATLSCLSSTA
ncbi:hypothetical protein [Bacteroides thetaiotaomicron]|uniref:hypothetical protein n=1 Tax=Bacteroides thetaiotaomicron TaxID=818 RepID=UPI0032619F75